MKVPGTLGILLTFIGPLVLGGLGCGKSSQVVGVGRSQVSTNIDLTDKLNPAILPDLMKEVLREIAPGQKPDSTEFQQQVVQKLSQKIMDDPEVNYRVDLNEDGSLDPVLVVPESVQGEAAVYSIRAPDPEKYPKDPPYNADWNQVAEDGLELVALSVTFDQTAQTLAVHAEANPYLYEGAPHHNYASQYPVHQYSWLETYVKYMIFRDILFGPYGWYGPRGWGWYGGYYVGWHAPVTTRRATRRVTRYQPAAGKPSPMKTASGQSVRSRKAAARTQAPRSIQAMKSKRVMQARQATGVRQGGFGRTRIGGGGRRSSGGFFRGGGGGFGK